jgi:hypothetical protein
MMRECANFVIKRRIPSSFINATFLPAFVYKLYKLFLNFTYVLSLKGPFEAAYKGSSSLGRIQSFAILFFNYFLSVFSSGA